MHRLTGIQSTIFLAAALFATIAAAEVRELGDRRELFVDRHGIESTSGSARLVMHPPQPAEIALRFDAPWEGPVSTYVTVLRDGDRYRMYYRASCSPPELIDPATGMLQPDKDRKSLQFACMAESKDGRTFTKPNLGVVEFEGSKANNIVLGNISHNFAPFKDERPDVPADERYKAVMTKSSPFPAERVEGRGLAAFCSPDGVHWRTLVDHTILTDGAFDSHNVAFWDPNHREYRSYYRIFPNKIREIGWCRSDDFRTWSPMQPIDQGAPATEHFYTNAITTYFRAPQYYFAFPKRIMERRVGKPGHRGVSDAVFLSSRDGHHFDRTFSEALIRPGRDELNWGDRATMPAHGLMQTGPDEMSIYYTQHYRYASAHVRRGVWRLDGIASLHAGAEPGELITNPFTFKGRALTLNYATSAAGNVQVEIQDADGKPIRGFTLADAPEAFGDKIDAPFAWKSGTDVSSLAGKPVRLRFVLRDADVYSYCFE